MSWKKHFRVVRAPNAPVAMPTPPAERAGAGTSSAYTSYLPEVYTGHPNRIQRYYQYADMDRDSDICAALDTLADFCTQSEEQNKEPFLIHYHDDANDTEVRILKTALSRWVKLNSFKSRLWNIFRGTLMNGDQFFLRDPENGEWLWIDHFMVEMVKVDENGGKEPDEYIIRGLDLNLQAKFATKSVDPSQYRGPNGTANVAGSRAQSASASGPAAFALAGGSVDPRSRQQMGALTDQMFALDAQHIIHLSLSVGTDVNWPFGQSVLESIFKIYKQKELLEDSIIIYRVQRAPERRIFKIDTGSMPPERARAHLEMVKNDIHQRRIPNRTAAGGSIMDAAYSPLAVLEDYFFAVGENGRGSSVETLPGGELVGEIGDLLYFSKKMARGLRIPTSYLSLGDEDGGSGISYNDGKLGAAIIQEFRFNKYCMRIQSLLAPKFDASFKEYLKKTGIEIDSDLFDLQLNPPQNFTKYRQIELDAQQAVVYQSVAENKMLSERFKLKRFLGLTEDEMLENERLWSEENAAKLKKKIGSTPAESNNPDTLGSVGIRDFGGGDDFDMENGDAPPADGEAPPDDGMGGMGAPPPPGGGAPPPPGGGGAPPPPPG